MRCPLIIAVPIAIAALSLPSEVVGQDEEGPGPRVVAVTSFDLPMTDRSKVVPYMVEYFLPGVQLNPKVLNFRVLLHNWGSNAAQVHLVSEYAEFGDIESECGVPCEEYQEQHPIPEEGSTEWAEFAEARDLFNQYYAHHRDEIYTTPMMVAKTEGEIVGRVGPPPETEPDN